MINRDLHPFVQIPSNQTIPSIHPPQSTPLQKNPITTKNHLTICSFPFKRFADEPCPNQQPRDPYNYSSQPPVESAYYNNGNYTSPVASTFPSRSPISHSHPAGGPISPPSRAPNMTSPSISYATAPGGISASNGASTPVLHHASPAPSVLKAPVPAANVCLIA